MNKRLIMGTWELCVIGMKAQIVTSAQPLTEKGVTLTGDAAVDGESSDVERDSRVSLDPQAERM